MLVEQDQQVQMAIVRGMDLEIVMVVIIEVEEMGESVELAWLDLTIIQHGMDPVEKEEEMGEEEEAEEAMQEEEEMEV